MTRAELAGAVTDVAIAAAEALWRLGDRIDGVADLTHGLAQGVIDSGHGLLALARPLAERLER